MRRKKGWDDKLEEINLTPIMNMVVILIPLLLLSVVFQQMGVINISSPKIIGGDTHVDPVERLSLTIGISTSGFTLTDGRGARLPPVEGCSPQNPVTICNRSEGDVAGLLDEVHALRSAYDVTGDKNMLGRSDARLGEAVEHFDFRQLYNTLVQLKVKYPEEKVVTVSADPSVPFELLVSTMDTARYKLQSPRDDGLFDSASTFETARYHEGHEGYTQLFADVTLALAR